MLHAAYYFEYSFFSFAIDNAGCEILNSYLQAYSTFQGFSIDNGGPHGAGLSFCCILLQF